MKQRKNRKTKEMIEENEQKELLENEPMETLEKEPIERLEKEQIELSERFNALNDKYLRLVAEFDNYRKRSSRERLELVKTAGEELIQGMLPVLDDLLVAQETMTSATDVQAVREGVDLIYRKLHKYLISKGMNSIEALGLPLDTDVHEAVAQVPTEDPKLKGKIIEVLRQGYTLNGKVIRYAQVVVGV